MKLKILLLSLLITSSVHAESALQYESTLYKNNQYRFQIMTPDTSTISQKFPGSYFFAGDEWRIRGSKNGIPIILIPYFIWNSNPNHEGGYYYSREVRIGVSKNKNDLDNCTKGASLSKKINGTIFSVFKDSDVSMNQGAAWISYRTLHNKQCYAIEEVFYYNNSIITQQLNKAKFDEIANEIIASFKFT